MTGGTSPWQLLPDLPAGDFAALKADIAAHGVRVPVVVDAETGAVIDGHHRLRAVAELQTEGIKVDYLRQSVRFTNDEQRLGFVLAANCLRRHLTRPQRAQLVADLRRRGWSLRRIGATIGVDHKTVRADLGQIGENSPISEPDRINRRGGGTYPARRPKPPPSVLVRTQRDEQRARAALVALGDQAPAGLVDLRRAEDLARQANLARRRDQPAPPATEGEGWEVRCGPFHQVLEDIPDQSVDAIVTDPPYTADGVPLYSQLSEFAARVLKPGRLCVAYTGKLDLPDTVARLGEHLTYVWTGAVFQPGRHSILRSRMIRGRWRPVLMFSAGSYQPRRWIQDAVVSDGRGDKTTDDHHWQQTAGPFVRFVEQITNPGELVVDPFTGSGTTGLACLSTGRRFLGADIDPGAVSLAVDRLRTFSTADQNLEPA